MHAENCEAEEKENRLSPAQINKRYRRSTIDLLTVPNRYSSH